MAYIIENIKKSYEKIILDNATFSLEPTKVYCLLGRNGAGKTTLMKILSGIVPYDDGMIKHEDKDISFKNVYYVPETPILLDYLSGYENLDFIRQLNKINISKDELRKTIENLGMKEFSDELVINYSHGMRHQLALAIAFLISPKLLLLDEPLVSLDPINIHYTRNQLINYAKRGNVVLISTHMIPIAKKISDEILILSNGQISQVEKKFTEEELENFVLEKI